MLSNSSINTDPVNALAAEALLEKKRNRRWKIFFRLVYLTIAVSLVFFWFGDEDRSRQQPHTAVVDLEGIISSDSMANAYDVTYGLENAFANEFSKGVILRINSPGGSPTQSELINQEILRLKSEYPDKPLYAVVEDIGASGGYYVAAAADKIFVSPSSVVGSIGVRMDGFDLTGAMQQLGIERRLFTAGKNKGFLDPFLPLNPEQEIHANSILNDIHQQFIDAVKSGRGDSLSDDPNIFSGLIWTGLQSIELGLADQKGSVLSVSRDVIKQKNIVNYSVTEGVAERIARRIGSELLYKTIMYYIY